MPSRYEMEVKERTEFVEASMRSFKDFLLENWNAAQKQLGNAAVHMLRNTHRTYISPVNNDVIVVPFNERNNDNIPVVALRDDESIPFDISFAQFSPAQRDNIRSFKDSNLKVKEHHLAEVERRAASDLPGANILKREMAVLRVRYHIPNFPGDNLSTEFQMRPLIAFNIGKIQDIVPPDIVANAFYLADKVIEKPVIIGTDEQRKASYDSWMDKANEFGDKVLRLAK